MVVLDVSFPIRGSVIPADHGYALFSALARLVPSLHDDETIGIHPISGMLIGGRMMRLTERSRLVLRMDSSKVGSVMSLAGKRLEVDRHNIEIGLPSPRLLRPANALRSRIVVIKGFIEPAPFLGACQRQMAAIGVNGQVILPKRVSPEPFEHGPSPKSPYVRRTLMIHGMTIVGYSVEVHELSDEDSVRLQEEGLGGRRRFGCGIFIPIRGGIP